MTNIQARFKNGKPWSDWRSFGDVRHVDAAKAIAEAVGYDVIEVETRDEAHPSVVFSHTVSRSVVYKIIPHRYDLSDDDD